MDSMDSLLGQPVNAMSSFMGSKRDITEENSGFSQFDPYGSFGNHSSSMDPSMSMLSNIHMNDMGLSSGSTSDTSAGNNRMNDPNAINQMIMNPLGTPNSNTDLPVNPMSQSVDSMSLGFADGPNNGAMHNMLDPSTMSGSPMPSGSGSRGPIGNVSDMGRSSQGGADNGTIDLTGMMKTGNSMPINQAGDQFNLSMRGTVGNVDMGTNPGNEFAPNMAARNIDPHNMARPGAPMDMYSMGPPMGMQPNMGRQPMFMNGALGMAPSQVLDPAQLPASALNNKRTAAANGRKKAQSRSTAPKKATAQVRNPRAPRAQKVKSATVSAAGTPIHAEFSPNMANQPPNQTYASPSLNTPYLQNQFPHQPLPIQQSPLAGTQLSRPPTNHEGPLALPQQQGFGPSTGVSFSNPGTNDPGPAAKLPVRQFEFSSHQPPPPRASGVLKLRVQFVLTLNLELIKILMSTGLGTEVSSGSIGRLESNLHYLRQVHSQRDISSALAVQSPILSSIAAIPSLSEPYRRLADLFKIKPMPAQT